MEFTKQRGVTAVLGSVAALAARGATRFAPLFVVAMLLLAGGLGYYAVGHLGIDTHTDRLLDPHLFWRVEEKAFNDAFPQNNHTLVIVVSAASPELVDTSARKLAAALGQYPDEFKDVNDEAGSEFLARNGLLFLDVPQLQAVTEQLIGAQGLLGTLIADPSLNGLFSAFNLALDGVKRGNIEASSLSGPLSAIAETLQQNQAGKPTVLSWRKMMTGLDPQPLELLRVVQTRAALDFNALMPGEKSSKDVRRIAQELGLTPQNGITVRLTGDVALDDEEFSSIERGMGVATVLSFALVVCILFLAVRALRTIIAIVVTLLTGLVFTFGFAAIAVGTLNLISIAFVVMFIGIAVDFSIQFCVRYRDTSGQSSDPDLTAPATAYSIGGALTLAAVTTAAGFLAFLPTNYKGVSELGIIAGAGMLIALILNVTLLPALLKLIDWRPRDHMNKLFVSAAPDEWIRRRADRILWIVLALGLLAAAIVPFLRFDFDPLNLKDPHSESIETLRDLTAAGAGGTNVMDVLTRDRAGAPALVARLEAMPEVDGVTWLGTFIPSDQPQKIKIIRDAAGLVLPSFDFAGTAPAASDQKTAATIRQTVRRLRALAGKPGAASFSPLADLLDHATQGPNPDLTPLKRSLLSGLDATLHQVSLLLQPTGVTEDSIPPNFKADWVSKAGQYRLEVAPKDKTGNSRALGRFIDAVRGVAPDAVGPAYFVQSAGDVVWRAFKEAFFYALVGVSIILFIALGHFLDALLVVVPLLFSALMTLATTVIIGLPINFANVIALPLLMGIGVAFNIYFVANWRAGETAPLNSSTARAVVLSSLTALTAFGSLALSPHAGTASLGKLLTLCLSYTLLTALVLLPALLARLGPRKH